MTVPRLPDRDGAQVDALVADRYLDALLAAGERRADDVPADVAVPPELREAARVLRRALVRVHPSFRFEERLATRLADLGAARRAGVGLDAAEGDRGSLVPFAPTRGATATRGAAGTPSADNPAAGDPLLAAVLAGDLDPADGEAVARLTSLPADRRPLLVGGAITSAAISLVGVAFIAWRATRPGARRGSRATAAMARAARAAHAGRAADLAGLAGRAGAGLAAAVTGTGLTEGPA